MAKLHRLLAPLLLALAGCSTPVQEADQGPLPVWPAAPDTARVAYVRSVSRPEDLGIGKGWIERLKDVFLGETESRLVRPMAVVAAGGVLYVADPGTKGVHRFDPRRGEYALVRGPDGRPLPSPVGLANGPGGEVYVSDSRLGQVLVISPGAPAARPLKLAVPPAQPTGLAYDAATRRLYVADTAGHRILAYGPDGSLAANFGRRGDGAGEFNYPTLLWLSGGRLHVTDSMNFRVQVFDPAGTFISAFGRQGDRVGDTPRPKGVASDRHGHIYLVDALHHNLQIFDAGGRFLLPVGQPGQAPGEFWLPTGVFVDGDDTIYVADAYNQRVQVLRYVGGAS